MHKRFCRIIGVQLSGFTEKRKILQQSTTVPKRLNKEEIAETRKRAARLQGQLFTKELVLNSLYDVANFLTLPGNSASTSDVFNDEEDQELYCYTKGLELATNLLAFVMSHTEIVHYVLLYFEEKFNNVPELVQISKKPITAAGIRDKYSGFVNYLKKALDDIKKEADEIDKEDKNDNEEELFEDEEEDEVAVFEYDVIKELYEEAKSMHPVISGEATALDVSKGKAGILLITATILFYERLDTQSEMHECEDLISSTITVQCRGGRHLHFKTSETESSVSLGAILPVMTTSSWSKTIRRLYTAVALYDVAFRFVSPIPKNVRYTTYVFFGKKGNHTIDTKDIPRGRMVFPVQTVKV